MSIAVSLSPPVAAPERAHEATTRWNERQEADDQFSMESDDLSGFEFWDDEIRVRSRLRETIPSMRRQGPAASTPERKGRLTRSVGLALAISAMTAGVGLLSGLFPSSKEPPRPNVKRSVPVTAMDEGLSPAHNSPEVIADPTEPRFLVLANRLDAPDFSCALQVSGNGGRGWVSVQTVRELPEGAEKCYAPEVSFDSSGTLYYLFVGLAGRGNEPIGVFLTTSTDRGNTFSNARQVLGPLNFGVRMAIDQTMGNQGRLHLAWLQATSDPPLGGLGPPPNPIMAAYSDDGGETFSTPIQVSDPDRERVLAPALTLAPDQQVHVGYYDLKDDAIDYQGLEGATWPGTWSLVVATSVDGGRRFRSGVVIDDGVRPHERVLLAFTMPPPALAGGADGVLCAAWTDARNGDADVLLRCSDDRGKRWNSPVRLNDDPIGTGRSQYMPRLGIAPDGRLDAIFYDRRDDPENFRNHLSYTFSVDGGETFASNVTVTEDPSNSQIGQRYLGGAAEGLVEFGSRLALLSLPDRAIAAWTDTRNSSGLGTGQSVFATEIVLAAEERIGFRLAGIALVFLGILGVYMPGQGSLRKKAHRVRQ